MKAHLITFLVTAIATAVGVVYIAPRLPKVGA
jgi:hypothetical protein